MLIAICLINVKTNDQGLDGPADLCQTSRMKNEQ